MALVATLALAAGAAAPPTGNFSMCALYVNQTRSEFSYGLVSPGGRVTDLIDLPGLFAVFDGAAAGAEQGVFYSYCGYGPPPQKSTGVLEANWLANTTVYRTVEMPKAYAGNFYTPELSTDWSGASLGLVGMIRGIEGPDDAFTWTAIARIDPKTGAAAVLRNLTDEAAAFKYYKTGCSTFDSDALVFYLIAGIGASEAETVLGFGKEGEPAIAIPFDPAYDALSLEWSASLKTLVALAYLRNAQQSTMAWLVHDAGKPGTWKPAFTWPVGTVFMSGMVSLLAAPRRAAPPAHSRPPLTSS
jgi:hypothetical protein